VVLIGTDGLWESRNPAGEMFGVPRLRQVLATWADKPAAAIHAAVMEKVHAFCAGGKPEDDITLMVLKAR
jgi:sigma-B regulation protein RsbU (phosphoserine phosphatase)